MFGVDGLGAATLAVIEVLYDAAQRLVAVRFCALRGQALGKRAPARLRVAADAGTIALLPLPAFRVSRGGVSWVRERRSVECKLDKCACAACSLYRVFLCSCA